MTAIANRYETLSDRGVEQDMARTWRDTAETLRMLGKDMRICPRRVAALAVTDKAMVPGSSINGG